MSHVTYKYIKSNPDINTYITKSDEALRAIGYTEHSYAHVEKAAHTAHMILTTLGFPNVMRSLRQLLLICTILGMSSTASTMRKVAP